MAEIPADANPLTVTMRNRRAFIRGVPMEAPPPTLADLGMSIDADGTIRDDANNPLIRIVGLPGVPADGAVLLTSPVQPDEMLPGESMAEAMARLGRAVVLHTVPAGEGSEADRD